MVQRFFLLLLVVGFFVGCGGGESGKLEIESLIIQLGDSDSYVSQKALERLVEIGEAAIPELIKVLGLPNVGNRQKLASQILQKIGGPSIQQLILFLENPAVNEKVADILLAMSPTLQKIGEPSVQQLIPFLENPAVDEEVADLLLVIGTTEAKQAVMNWIGSRQTEITILQHTLVITNIENGLMTVMELIQAKNQGAMIQQQDNQPIILCSLPKEYLNLKLEPQSVGKLEEDSGNLKLQSLIKPSETQNFGFTYVIRFSETPNLSRRITCETMQLNTFVPDGIPLVPKTKFLKENQQERIHEQNYNIYTTNPETSLQGGQLADIRFQIKKPPSTSGTHPHKQINEN